MPCVPKGTYGPKGVNASYGDFHHNNGRARPFSLYAGSALREHIFAEYGAGTDDGKWSIMILNVLECCTITPLYVPSCWQPYVCSFWVDHITKQYFLRLSVIFSLTTLLDKQTRKLLWLFLTILHFVGFSTVHIRLAKQWNIHLLPFVANEARRVSYNERTTMSSIDDVERHRELTILSRKNA